MRVRSQLPILGHMQRGTVLFVAASILIVGVIGGGVFYASTQPTRMERIVACVDRLGGTPSVYHDDGIETTPYPEGTIVLSGPPFEARHVRPAANHVRVTLHNGHSADIAVPDDGGGSRIAYEGHRPTAGERAAIAVCASA